MDITKLHLGIDAFSNGGNMIVTDIKNKFKFENGHVTNEIEGFAVEVVCPANGYEKFTVKVSDKPAINDDMLGKASVSFTGFAAKIWKDYKNNRYEISCAAKSVQVVVTK